MMFFGVLLWKPDSESCLAGRETFQDDGPKKRLTYQVDGRIGAYQANNG